MTTTTIPLQSSVDGTILRHPDRPEARYSLPRAIKNFRLLMKDKEDTSLVFKIYESLPPRGYVNRVADVVLSERGEDLRRTEPNLPEILDDHTELRKTPKGSLAHAYCDFMESEGLSAAGLVAEFDKLGRPQYPDLMQWYMARSRDTHDLFHVLTGYGRDALGEQCVLLFTHGQSPSQGHLLIGYAGSANIKMMVRGSKAPVMGAVRQAKKTGKGAPKLLEQPIRELLKMPLDEVRTMLNIPEPTQYRECHRIWRKEGIDPMDLLASSNTPSELVSA
ncbi:Coq4 family protein [Erythrobacter sp. F6033]|uniref:Coq4 family protein n=1 Tax=Erythrobacter sp. F6033 TaxID=2926401 RepID=UPI001FF41DE0|nr:Coq4 family protein [Erythrobacter sp. F6033]MCK0128495.1 Coq4 family protein [Erythrobacter sp. F6033]